MKRIILLPILLYAHFSLNWNVASVLKPVFNFPTVANSTSGAAAGMMKQNSGTQSPQQVPTYDLWLSTKAAGRTIKNYSGTMQIRSTSNIVISDYRFDGSEEGLLDLMGCSNVIIERCAFFGSYHRPLSVENSTNITIRDCYFENTGDGVYAANSTDIKTHNNWFKNMQGPSSSNWGVAIQYNNVNISAPQGAYIKCNYIVNEVGKSDPQDNINLVNGCKGASGNVLEIAYNYVYAPGATSGSGGGILLADNGASYIKGHHNVLIQPGQYGMAVATGTNCEISDNIIYQTEGINVGIVVWNPYNGPCSGNVVKNNRVWYQRKGGLLVPNWWNDCGFTESGNAWNDASLTGFEAPPACSDLPVPGVNKAPVASVSPTSQTITLPTNSATFDGSASSDDGGISSYLWEKTAGPSTFAISSPKSSKTSMTNLVEGSYTFRLTVTDNTGLQASRDVTVTVNAATNQAPKANAGPDKSIQLPTDYVTLSGSGTDADGTVKSYSWSQVSGPNKATISGATSATSEKSGLVEGTYVFRLTVTDDKGATGTDDVSVTVAAASTSPNKAPIANAGSDKTIQLPTSSVSLTGTGTDGDGTVTAYAWSQVSGPNTAAISAPGSAQTNASGLVEGTYVFRLTVTDNSGAKGTDDVQVTVNPAPNLAPAADAGNDQTIQLPTSTATATGTATDPDGTISSYAWGQVSGPNTATITAPRSAKTDMSGLVKGTYIFRLTVTDNGGAKASDDISVVVQDAPAPANLAPTVATAADISIQYPTDYTTLSGSGKDSDGTIASYAWRLVSGPNTPNIVDPAKATTEVNGLIVGTYAFRLTVTDNAGAKAYDDISVVVLAASTSPVTSNKAPVANAGGDLSITLPVNSTKLNGTKSSDPDGQIVSYKWVKIKGPKVITITNDNTATPDVSGLDTKGTYEIELTVTDDKGAVAKDVMTITVIKINKKPVAMATDTVAIALPSTSVELDGSASYDPDGNINQYLWTFNSGPDTPRILSHNKAKAIATDLIAGTYTFTLDVVDNDGGLSTKTITVVVNNLVGARLVPIVNAYPNPATSQLNFTIETPANGRTTITLFNVSGRPVYNEVIGKNSTLVKKTINIGDLPRGTYFAVVQVDGQEKAVKKIIKL